MLEGAHGKRKRVLRSAVQKALLAGLIGNSALLGFGLVHALAADKSLVNKGELLARQNCSRCHAIGKDGDSPHPQAPAFRTLSSKYPIENLENPLPKGLSLATPTCPSLFSARTTLGHHTISAKRPAQAAQALSTVEHTINVTKASTHASPSQRKPSCQANWMAACSSSGRKRWHHLDRKSHLGVASAGGSKSNILVAGVAGLVAGAMSMAAGEYVSVSSQSDTEHADLAREARETREGPEVREGGTGPNLCRP